MWTPVKWNCLEFITRRRGILLANTIIQWYDFMIVGVATLIFGCEFNMRFWYVYYDSNIECLLKVSLSPSKVEFDVPTLIFLVVLLYIFGHDRRM